MPIRKEAHINQLPDAWNKPMRPVTIRKREASYQWS